MENLEFTENIRTFYDLISPHYQMCWGPHFHHGYYLTGRESKHHAVEALLQALAKKSSLQAGSRILDVGCGIGGASVWLSKTYHCEVTGITISPKQIELANEASKDLLHRPNFLLMDANDMFLDKTFDAVWAIEVLSHLHDHRNFFSKCRSLLNKGGKICMAAWLKADNLSEHEERKYIRPIEEGMLCRLPTVDQYLRLLDDNNFSVIDCEDVSSKVKQTWDLGLEIIKNKSLWKLAAAQGKIGLTHLKAFRKMKKGYEKGKLMYLFIIAEKAETL